MANKSKGDDVTKMSVEELQAEDLRLQVEERRWRIEEMRQAQESRKRERQEILDAHKEQQKAIDSYNTDVLARQKLCRHRKGGKNQTGILNGSSPERSVIVHTFPWGEVMVMCTRCCREWRKPKAELARKNPKLYAVQMQEYTDALRFPTDNEPSGSQLFTFTRNEPSFTPDESLAEATA